MPLAAEAILAHVFDPRDVTITDRDAMLFALSIGVGRDPMNADELRYVYEQDLVVFPTLPVVLGHPGPWMAEERFRIDRRMLVHGTQRLELTGPLVVGAPLRAENRVIEIVDKGPDRGAIIVSERLLRDVASGALVARIESGTFCRADGGCGGPAQPSRAFRPVPSRSADASIEMKTEPNQALWYRLNGDRNPLHADPAFAARAGFPRPILHGLCTYSIAAHALMRQYPDRPLRMIETRFSKPVYPGETVRVQTWEESGGVAFRARVDARDAVVLDFGFAEFAPA